MFHDPVGVIGNAVRSFLRSTGSTQVEPILHPKAPWRPSIYEPECTRAWYILSEVPESDLWIELMQETRRILPQLRLGITGPTSVLQSESVLDIVDELEAAILPVTVDEERGEVRPEKEYTDACEFIYEENLRLEHSFAGRLLDRGLVRAVSDPDNRRKGIRLEAVTALVLSQVDGWEVKSKGILRRSQQADVAVHNLRVGGFLGRGELVLAETKNWTRTTEAKDYIVFLRKLTSSSGMAQLGFFVTTDHHSQGVYIEALRDSEKPELIVTLDKISFPAVWRDSKSMADGIERMVFLALQDQRQRIHDQFSR